MRNNAVNELEYLLGIIIQEKIKVNLSYLELNLTNLNKGFEQFFFFFFISGSSLFGSDKKWNPWFQSGIKTIQSEGFEEETGSGFKPAVERLAGGESFCLKRQEKQGQIWNGVPCLEFATMLQ